METFDPDSQYTDGTVTAAAHGLADSLLGDDEFVLAAGPYHQNNELRVVMVDFENVPAACEVTFIFPNGQMDPREAYVAWHESTGHGVRWLGTPEALALWHRIRRRQ